MVLIKTDGVGAYATPSPKNQTKTNIYINTSFQQKTIFIR